MVLDRFHHTQPQAALPKDLTAIQASQFVVFEQPSALSPSPPLLPYQSTAGLLVLGRFLVARPSGSDAAASWALVVRLGSPVPAQLTEVSLRMFLVSTAGIRCRPRRHRQLQQRQRQTREAEDHHPPLAAAPSSPFGSLVEPELEQHPGATTPGQPGNSALSSQGDTPAVDQPPAAAGMGDAHPGSTQGLGSGRRSPLLSSVAEETGPRLGDDGFPGGAAVDLDEDPFLQELGVVCSAGSPKGGLQLDLPAEAVHLLVEPRSPLLRRLGDPGRASLAPGDTILVVASAWSLATQHQLQVRREYRPEDILWGYRCGLRAQTSPIPVLGGTIRFLRRFSRLGPPPLLGASEDWASFWSTFHSATRLDAASAAAI